MSEKPVQERKTVQWLKKLPAESLDAFEQYLASYLNPYPRLVRAMEVLRKQVLPDSAPPVSAADFYKAAFGDQPFREGTLYTLFSRLHEVLFDFIALQGFQNNPDLRRQAALKSFATLIPDLRPEALNTELTRRIKVPETPSTESAWNNHNYHYQLSPFYKHHPLDFNESYWLTLDSSLEQAYQLRKLEIAVGISTFNRRAGLSMQPEGLESLLTRIEAKLDKAPPLSKAYFWSWQLLESASPEAAWQNLKSLLFTGSLKTSEEEEQSFYLSLLNFGMQQQNKGRLEFDPEVNALLDFGLEKGWFETHGKIHARKLKNIISLKARMGMVEEAVEVWDWFREKILDDEAGGYANLIHGILEYYRESWQTAIRLLDAAGEKKLSDWHLGLELRLFEILARLERHAAEDVDLLPYRFDSFSNFLRRNQALGEQQRQAYRAFISHLKTLFRLSSKPEPQTLKELEQLAHTISTAEPLFNRSLLLSIVKKRLTTSN